jgi:flagellar basal-body rod protein FlgF
VSITHDGKLFQGKEQVGELSVVEFVDNKMLTKEGSALFRNEMAANIAPDVSATTVRQGMLETSNVNSIQEMTELLKATRMFEANQKMVRAYGEMESRAVNEIGKL